jgi:SET domain-containing protein
MRRTWIPSATDVHVRRSSAGRGLFTDSPIPRGACIIEYVGRPATKRQIEADTGLYLFWTSTKTMIDGNVAGNVARFINHSCAPNCEIDIKDRRIYVFAKRAIRAGEELMYDYDTEYFEKHIQPRGCACLRCKKRDLAANSA